MEILSLFQKHVLQTRGNDQSHGSDRLITEIREGMWGFSGQPDESLRPGREYLVSHDER